MAKRKGKSVSFDAMVKFFLQYHNIPTKKDIDRLMVRMDRLEKLIQNSAAPSSGKSAGSVERKPRVRAEETAADAVLQVIRQAGGEIGFAQIKDHTEFDDKKLRNIIYRLNKIGRIQRIRRGVYQARD